VTIVFIVQWLEFRVWKLVVGDGYFLLSKVMQKEGEVKKTES